MFTKHLICGTLRTLRYKTPAHFSTTPICRVDEDKGKQVIDDVRYANTIPTNTSTIKPVVLSEEATSEITEISGDPAEHKETRMARIFQPARNAMQSGWSKTHHWVIELDAQQRWENPNIGWSSTADPLSNISMALSFASKEDAIHFCDKKKWTYEVLDKQERTLQPKAYGSNFSWNRRTRVSTK